MLRFLFHNTKNKNTYTTKDKITTKYIYIVILYKKFILFF